MRLQVRTRNGTEVADEGLRNPRNRSTESIRLVLGVRRCSSIVPTKAHIWRSGDAHLLQISSGRNVQRHILYQYGLEMFGMFVCLFVVCVPPSFHLAKELTGDLPSL